MFGKKQKCSKNSAKNVEAGKEATSKSSCSAKAASSKDSSAKAKAK